MVELALKHGVEDWAVHAQVYLPPPPCDYTATTMVVTVIQ